VQLIQHVLVGVDSDKNTNLQNVVREIQSLATTPDGIKRLLSTANFRSSDKPLKESFVNEASKAFAAEEKRLADVLGAQTPSDAFQFVDRALTQLQILRIQ
jgi:hypothetical protein